MNPLSKICNQGNKIVICLGIGVPCTKDANKLIFSNAKIKAVDIPVTSKDTIIQANVLCDLSVQDERNKRKREIPVDVTPNPATSFISVKTPVDLPFNIYSMDGSLKIRSLTNHPTDISSLKPGVYVISILIKDEVVRKLIIKR